MREDVATHLRPNHAEETGEQASSQELLPKGYAIFFLLFFLSGMCALVYEVTWTRRLILVFGNTVYSVSTVLVAFMGGLAFGSVFFGRLIDRRQDPVRVYGLLEIGIGISAVLIPLALAGLNPAYRLLYSAFGASNYVMSLTRFVLSIGVLIVPTTLMGATLPVLSKFIVRRIETSGLGIGSLYAINTLGAVAGCLLGGFVLIGSIGITRSEQAAAVVNMFIGLTAFRLHHKLGGVFSNVTDADELGGAAEGVTYQPGILRFVLLIFGVSGMLALAYEVLWTRILVFLLGSSIYSFSMILAVYLLGLTAGSLLMARIVEKVKWPLHVFGWLEVLIGVSVLAGMLLFNRLPFQEYGLRVNPLSYLSKNFLGTLAVVLPPTLLMGATFPVAVRIYARSLDAIGRQTGALYAVNTVGAIVGSFASGFVMIPLLGSKNSMMLLILLSIAAGFSLLYLSMRREGSTALNWIAGGLLILPLAGFPFGNELMKDLSLKASKMQDGRVIAFDEDATATVAVLGRDVKRYRMLSVNGYTMAILCTDTQLMAHLPLALLWDKDPQDVLNICFGMGTTFVSARRAGMNVDFVELCPYVVKAFKYFQEDPSMLNKPGVGEIIADGRNYLLLSDKSYDLITIDPPPPPWSVGTANLCTKEFYELCKERLRPDGIICQWLPTVHDALSVPQYRMLLRTFMEVFPHTSVWGSPSNFGTYLIGTPERLRIDKESFDEYFEAPAVKADFSLYYSGNVDGSLVLSLLMLDEDAARDYVAGAPVMTDDLPVTEFPLFRNGSSTKIMDPDLLLYRRLNRIGTP